ncbi:MAG: GTPase HflX [Alphaproteobacteria bacterium]
MILQVDDRVGGGRAIVLNPYERRRAARDEESRLEEAIGLAAAIELDVVHSESVRLTRPRPATLIGGGVVERMEGLIQALDAELLVVNAALTPIQQRNLEQVWKCKVIDRTGLILEIFGARARTHEGVLQVELAALGYQRSRLVRSWTHLERQRGGFGFTGGPGERQIELDRRLIDQRIDKLKRELVRVKRTRTLHRSARKKTPTLTVALVGYTNAGKSTLFNKLTGATVEAKDLLFATLDPTIRQLKLPSGQEIVLSDTVGFISELPTTLIAAFQATLEEVLEADLIVHVRDISHKDTDQQKQDVEQVLTEIGLDMETLALIEALNKIDLLDDGEKEAVIGRAGRDPETVAISAVTGEGGDELIAEIEARLAQSRHEVAFSIDVSEGATMAWLYAHGDVRQRSDDERKITLSVVIDDADLARFKQRFGVAALS